MLLNKEAYTMAKDKLVYDSKHPIDGKNVTVKITVSEAGTIKRGQIIDLASDGTYALHANNGDPCAIVAADADYKADDTTVVCEVYTSGAFRKSEIIATPDINTAGCDKLRARGIFLK